MKIIHSNERTAGLTSEAAVAAIGNRYDLVLVASRRLRELNRGDMRKVASKNSNSVAVLEEIEQGKITRDYLYREQDLEPRLRRRTNGSI